jgi:Kef-type K+ transport system membrane component KefB
LELGILPGWPLSGNDFLLFGVILLAGVVGGEIAHRSKYFPRITGFVASGFLLGPSVTGLISADMLSQARIFTDIALGLILFQLGLQLDMAQLRQNRTLLLSSIAEGLLSFSAICLVLTMLGISPLHAALVAAVGVSSSPAVVLLVAREFNAQGPVTERALSHVAMNNFLSFFLFTLLLPFLHYSQLTGWSVIMLQPFYQAGASLVLAYLLARLCIMIARHLGRNENQQFALLVGVIIVAIGLSAMLHCSNLLTLLATGVLVRNLDVEDDLMMVEFGHAGDIFFVLLFVIAGANLHVHALITVWWTALAFVGVRFVGKTLGLLILAPFSSLSFRQTSLLGLTLVPMAGMAIGLTDSLSSLYPVFSQELTAIVLGSVTILETVGPILTEFALKRAGEISPESQITH